MPLFAATIALSAFLLFLVQPIVARQILPWFGGSAAVWTTCMLFFQLVLLAGYAYSDAVIRRLRPRAQSALHGALLLASLAFLPITADVAFRPPDADNPTGRILLLLAATIGLPYLLLSTTGPLVQAWFARRHAHRRVWRLYALSNLASMAALLAYPPIVEPLATGRMQAIGWSAGYALFVLLALAAAWSAREAHAPAAVLDAAADRVDAVAADAPPRPGQQALWLLLAALGSVMLLSVTTHITQNVASVPFLWVLPLAIYLLTFILCFDAKGWYRRSWYGLVASVMLVVMLGGLSWRYDWDKGSFVRGLIPLDEAVPLYAFGLFVLCMFCHGELVERRPAPRHLTRFYLMIALGGALGGIVVAVVAPLAFDWYWEFPIALAGLAAVLIFLTTGPIQLLAAAAFCVSLIGLADHAKFVRADAIEISRNFYGVLRVKASAPESDPTLRWRLLHGSITHGEQFRSPGLSKQPTTYYGPQSGVGVALASVRALAHERPMRVGLIGLGVGTLASYAAEGDVYRVYELNPAVVDFARRHFSYLADSAARIEFALGDARLVLEREPPQRFDVLAVDAFSSDSIPVHLITVEAIREYRRHLAEGGVIAFHVSNRYLDLTGVVRLLADEIGWHAIRVVADPAPGTLLYRSDWVLVTADAALAERLEAGGGQRIAVDPALRAWTDDFHNLFRVLR